MYSIHEVSTLTNCPTRVFPTIQTRSNVIDAVEKVKALFLFKNLSVGVVCSSLKLNFMEITPI